MIPMFFFPTTDSEVISAFANLEDSASKDVKDLQLKPIKYVIDLLSTVLTYIF